MAQTKTPDPKQSYAVLRRWIGILGILLAPACMLGGLLEPGQGLRSSISMYWHSNMRDLFEGLMASTSIFLLTYRGYDLRDRLISVFAGLAGLLVALFPCLGPAGATELVGILRLPASTSLPLHLGAAFVFFALLAANSALLFTLSDKPVKKRGIHKDRRNQIYRAAGAIIVVLLLLLCALSLWVDEALLEASKAPLFIETLMLLAFGTSWLVKGETLFRDPHVGVTKLSSTAMSAKRED